MSISSATLHIDTTIEGEIFDLPARAFAGVAFNGKLQVTNGSGGSIPRFPFSSTDVSVSTTTYASVALNYEWQDLTNWSNGICTFETSVSASCDATYSLMYSGTLAQATVTVFPNSIYVFISGPDYLHIYGEGRQLRIELVIDGVPPSGGERATVSASVDDTPVSLSDYLEMSDGSPVDFTSGWNNGVWSGHVRAKSGASLGMLKIEASYVSDNTTYSDVLCLSIINDLDGTVEFSPDRAAPNAQFSVTLTVTSSDGEPLPRLPSSGGVSVTHAPDSGSATMRVNGAEPVFAFVHGTCALTGCTVDAECIYTIEITFPDGSSTANSISISVTLPNTSNLIEAINERRIIRAKDTLDPNASYTLSDLKGYAEDAIAGFVNGGLNTSTGYYPKYPSSGTMPALPSDPTDPDAYAEWVRNAYSLVCRATRRSFDHDANWIHTEIKRAIVPGNVWWNSSHYGPNEAGEGEDRWDPPVAEVERGLEQESRRAFTRVNDPDGSHASQWSSKYYVNYSNDTPDPYGYYGYWKFYRPSCSSQPVRAKCVVGSTQIAGTVAFSRTCVFIAQDISTKSVTSFDHYTRMTAGAKCPPEGKYGAVLNTTYAAKGQDFGWSAWSHSISYHMASKWGCYDYYGSSDKTAFYKYGFEYQLTGVCITYQFKHR